MVSTIELLSFFAVEYTFESVQTNRYLLLCNYSKFTFIHVVYHSAIKFNKRLIENIIYILLRALMGLQRLKHITFLFVGSRDEECESIKLLSV